VAGREDEIILRLVLDKPQLASFFPEGSGWTLIIGESVVEPTAPVGPPLGIGWLGPRVDGVVEMPEGSTLLLFTDGLFERRDGDLDEGRERLRAAARELAGQPLDELCDGLLAALLDEGAEDDVALLAVRAHPQRPLEPLAGVWAPPVGIVLA